MRTLVAGAHGLTGRRLLQRLSFDGHQAIAITRDRSQKDELLQYGAYDILEADLVKNRDNIDDEMKRNHYDVFFFVAGAASKTRNEKPSSEMTKLVDRDSAIAIAEICKTYSTFFILLSSIGAENPDQEKVPESLRHYMRMKHEADEHVISLGKGDNPLRYMIFRPGYLTDYVGNEKIMMSEYIQIDSPDTTFVAREDVAKVLTKAAELKDRLYGRVLYFIAGDTYYLQALLQFAKSE
jgi:nucleoside-diphosphate-sugar epimerase